MRHEMLWLRQMRQQQTKAAQNIRADVLAGLSQ